MTVQEARKLLPNHERYSDKEIEKLLAENYAIANLVTDIALSDSATKHPQRHAKA